MGGRHRCQPVSNEGHDALWRWFGLSRASWLTMPRAMMHAMPDDWQARMAELCGEWDEAWSHTDGSPLAKLGTPSVTQRVHGKLTKWPPFVLNYRHPDVATIDTCRSQSAIRVMQGASP